MIVYLASPANQLQADSLKEMPTLLSFGCWADWIDKYQQIFSRILIDSGAFSELNTGKKIDGEAYKDWLLRWEGRVDATAGLDDISGDWRRSLKNYELYGGFPSIHDTDPPGLLEELLDISEKQGNNWIGIGLKPPRQGKEKIVRDLCDKIPPKFHVHGWALRAYTHISRLDSVDSTNWWRDAMRYRKEMPWLTYGETLEIVVKRYLRWKRVIKEPGMKGFSDD